MITPTKGISADRALLTIAAQTSMVLTEPMTVSQLWNALRSWRKRNHHSAIISFAWFVLAVDLLYALDVVRLDNGLLHQVRRG